jgi:hypothetical protein
VDFSFTNSSPQRYLYAKKWLLLPVQKGVIFTVQGFFSPTKPDL